MDHEDPSSRGKCRAHGCVRGCCLGEVLSLLFESRDQAFEHRYRLRYASGELSLRLAGLARDHDGAAAMPDIVVPVLLELRRVGPEHLPYGFADVRLCIPNTGVVVRDIIRLKCLQIVYPAAKLPYPGIDLGDGKDLRFSRRRDAGIPFGHKSPVRWVE